MAAFGKPTNGEYFRAGIAASYSPNYAATPLQMKYRVSGTTGVGNIDLPIDVDLFTEISAAQAFGLADWDVEEKLSLLLDNYYEFEIELLQLAQKSVIWTDPGFIDTMQRRLSLDRRLVNVLTACRLYLDQTDHIISEQFGKDSKELEAIKTFKNNQYDMYWGYRLMEALRNHAQHAGLIVHTIGHQIKNHYDHKEGEPALAPYAIEFIVIPQTSVITLMQNGKFKKPVMEELKSKGMLVDLRKPIREYVSRFIAIHLEIRKLLETRRTKAREVYGKALAEFGTHAGHKVHFPTLERLDDAGGIVARLPLVSDFFEAADSLRAKNDANKNLSSCFASNRVLD